MVHIKMDSTQQRSDWGRIVFLASCALAAAGALWQRNASWPVWLAIVLPLVTWPLLARWRTRRTGGSDINDVILSFVDGLVIGVWVALVHFHLLTSAIMLMVLVHCAYAMQSVRHAVLAIAGAIAGVAVAGLLTSFDVQHSTSSFTIVGSLLAVALYLAMQGIATGHLLRSLAHKEQMLMVMRRVDAMTGFFGRMYWQDLATRLFAYAKQKDIPAFLIVVDVDNFRELNSRHGDTAGDEVIIAVANTLRTCVRPGDATCRFGGDSFAVLLSGVNLDIANQIADRIHSQALNRRLRDWPDVQISVSIGIASLAKYHQSVDDWIHQAEAALEQARGAPRSYGSHATLEPISAAHLAELASMPGPGAPAGA